MIFFHKKEAEKIELGARPGSTLGILEELKKSWSGVTRNFRKYFLQFHWGELAMGRDGIRFCICQFDNNSPPPCQKNPETYTQVLKRSKWTKIGTRLDRWHFEIEFDINEREKKSSKSNDRQILVFILLFLCDISQWNWVSCCDTPWHSQLFLFLNTVENLVTL